MPTFDGTREGYSNLWKKASIRSADKKNVERWATKIFASKTIYRGIEQATGVPWYMIGAIQYRESSLSFTAHLHCGDPLTARTFHVPKGRPVKGSPPFTWAESAIDALTMAPHSLNKVKEWTIERTLYECERYNGWGYINKTNSPYIWSGTNLYSGGKYVADGKYDPKHWDKQLGCAALIMRLTELDNTINLKSNPAVPKDLIAEDKEQHEADKTRRKIRDSSTGGAVISGGAGATGVATDSSTANGSLTAAGILFAAIAIGVAVYIVHKRKQAKDRATLHWIGEEGRF